MNAESLFNYLDQYLRLADFDDYGPQGLQVEADRPAVARVALAVDTAPPVIEAAAAWGAGLLLVHHGLFWGAVQPIAGPLGARVRRLLAHDMHLYAAHLALDAHPEVGNNAGLARLLGIDVAGWWCAPRGAPIGVWGEPPAGTRLPDLVERLGAALGVTPRLIPQGPDRPRRVAIVSGSGLNYAAEAWTLGADTLVTGETAHVHYWAAADHHLNVIFGGHYATETIGVQALGRHLAHHFDLETRFFDFPTGM